MSVDQYHPIDGNVEGDAPKTHYCVVVCFPQAVLPDGGEDEGKEHVYRLLYLIVDEEEHEVAGNHKEYVHEVAVDNHAFCAGVGKDGDAAEKEGLEEEVVAIEEGVLAGLWVEEVMSFANVAHILQHPEEVQQVGAKHNGEDGEDRHQQ